MALLSKMRIEKVEKRPVMLVVILGGVTLGAVGLGALYDCRARRRGLALLAIARPSEL
jgi:hypothetical protein